jgi:hypothetical protein
MPRGKNKRIALRVGLLVFLAAQLVPIDRSNPAVHSDLPAPPKVKAILQRHCYACHSNETAWPWYGYVAPVSWLMAKNVRDARDEMNFSAWIGYRPDKRRRLLQDVLEQVDEGEMPPWSYRLLRRDAGVAGRDLETLRAWVEGRAPDP